MPVAGWSSLFLLMVPFNCAVDLSWRCSKKGFESEETQPPSPEVIPQDTVWQPVANTINEFFVYSAFVEIRHFVGVRVLGITATFPPRDEVFCRMWLADERILTLAGRIQVFPEHTRLKYSAIYVNCELGDNNVQAQEMQGASLAVIASMAANEPSTNLLKVIYPFPIGYKPESHDFYGVDNPLIIDRPNRSIVLRPLHVCVKPFHLTYDRVEWTVEWIEMNRMLGVSHFYMYNDSVSDQMDCLLSHYQRKGLITLLPWDIPESIANSSVIRIRGQFVAFNDCLYRSMTKAGWLMFIDTDELVIPQQESKLTTMLDSVARNYSNSHPIPGDRLASYEVRNYFFYLGWEDDPVSLVPLISSRKTRRSENGNAMGERSKYIVRPLEVIEPGNHFVWKHTSGAWTEYASDEIAKLHHYREDRVDKLNNTINGSVVDRIAHRWTNKLWKRVKTKLANIQCLQLDKFTS